MYAVAIEPKGNLVAAGGFTATGGRSPIYLIKASTGVIEQSIFGMPDLTTRLEFSADGQYLAAGTFGIRIFDRTKNWSQVFADYDNSPIYGLAFSRDGRLASSSGDGTVRLYSRDFHLISKYKRNGGGFAWSVAFRPPDGDVLAVGFTQDNAFGVVGGRQDTFLRARWTNDVGG
jgi:WD40 repeat protein